MVRNETGIGLVIFGAGIVAAGGSNYAYLPYGVPFLILGVIILIWKAYRKTQENIPKSSDDVGTKNS